MERKLAQLPDDLKAAIRGSIFKYLWGKEQAFPYKTKTIQKATVWNEGIVREIELPAGTEGYVFLFPQIAYSEYRWVNDEQYPASGAQILQSGTDFQFVALYQGQFVEIFSYETRYPAKVIGIVS